MVFQKPIVEFRWMGWHSGWLAFKTADRTLWLVLDGDGLDGGLTSIEQKLKNLEIFKRISYPQAVPANTGALHVLSMTWQSYGT